MNPDPRPMPGQQGPDTQDRITVTARWDGERWAVSIPNLGGRANTFAETLADVVPSAAVVLGHLRHVPPADLELRIDVEPCLAPEVADRFKAATDPFYAAQGLSDAGLCNDDVRSLMAARLYSAIASTGADGIIDLGERGR